MGITFTIAATIASTIYLTAYVWTDDAVLADLNGVGVNGSLTRYGLQRTCFFNLLLLMAGSLITVLKKNFSDNSYFVIINGNVLRADIMELEPHQLSTDPDGEYDTILTHS